MICLDLEAVHGMLAGIQYSTVKVVITDMTALFALLPSAVKGYLGTRGWAETESDGTFAVFEHPGDGDIIALDVPLRASSGDYARRLTELLHNLELLEGRSQLDIYHDINACSPALHDEC